jgi:hypothetical protein
VTEGGCFSAGVTLCHDIYPFNTMIPDERPFWGAGHSTIERNHIQD